MKTALFVVLFVVAAGLAAFCVHQRSQIIRLRTEFAAANDELRVAREQLKEKADADRRISYAERKTQLLQDTLTQTSAVAARQSEEVSQLEQFLAAAKTDTNAGKSLSGLFKDPAMRDMIKAQQKAYLGPMIDKAYAAFFSQLNLTPEQSRQMKDLLEKKMLVASEVSMSGMDSNMDAAKRADLGQQVKSQTDVYDAQIRQLLGEDNYREFQTYEQGVPDRMVVGQLRDQLASTGVALSAAQERQLGQVMQEERTAFKWTTDFGRNNPDGSSPEMPNEEQLKRYAEEKEVLDRQILARSATILSSEQLAAFERFQASQRQIQISVMKLASKMFAPKGQ